MKALILIPTMLLLLLMAASSHAYMSAIEWEQATIEIHSCSSDTDCCTKYPLTCELERTQDLKPDEACVLYKDRQDNYYIVCERK